MNRIALAVSRQLRTRAVAFTAPRVTNCAAVAVSAPRFVPARMFGAAPGGAVEPFLDVKMVTERIIEVLKNFEKVGSNNTKVSSLD